jgi:hypothetical protein
MKLGERQFQLRIPLSPPEVKTFGVEKLTWVIVLDKNEEEVGKIIENPVHTGSIEEELLYILFQKK